MTFEIYANKFTRPGKKKCGDSFVVSRLPAENLILLAVADGVSSAPCDWLASQTACEWAVESFTKNSTLRLEERIQKAVEKAHSLVRQTEIECRGMLTSLSLVVLEDATDYFYLANVGDSRIYAGSESNLQQITIDDAQRVLLTRPGKRFIQPVFRYLG